MRHVLSISFELPIMMQPTWRERLVATQPICTSGRKYEKSHVPESKPPQSTDSRVTLISRGQRTTAKWDKPHSLLAMEKSANFMDVGITSSVTGRRRYALISDSAGFAAPVSAFVSCFLSSFQTGANFGAFGSVRRSVQAYAEVP